MSLGDLHATCHRFLERNFAKLLPRDRTSAGGRRRAAGSRARLRAMTEYRDIAAFAEHAARRAGAAVSQLRATGSFTQRFKGSDRDLVTSADLTSNDILF